MKYLYEYMNECGKIMYDCLLLDRVESGLSLYKSPWEIDTVRWDRIPREMLTLPLGVRFSSSDTATRR